MDKIIFLDIDGVLNCQNTFLETNGYRKAINLRLKDEKKRNYDNLYFKKVLLEIDLNKIFILKKITDITGAKIVVSSSWRLLNRYPLVEEYLISLGLPIIDVTPKMNNRGEEINFYIENHHVQKYAILDDEVFPDFTEENKYNLIWTSFYQNGLTEEHINDAIKILGKK